MGKEQKHYFFEDAQMEFEVQILLGSCHYGSADAGEILSTVENIPSGDCEAWFQEWLKTAARIESIAKECVKSNNLISARRAYLRAATYFSTAAIFIDGTEDVSRGVVAWKRHIECWEEFCRYMSAKIVEIPYENTHMRGYLFTPSSEEKAYPTIIFNNGSDGSTAGMWGAGVAAALERGYGALVFDGPGQNSMLWLQNIGFRYDWEKVITPVVDFLEKLDEVDSSKIILSGISQGGYWILRALAYEHRIIAGIADPGVIDVSTSFMRNLPPEMIEMLDDDAYEDEFNGYMLEGLSENDKQTIEWRFKPYQESSYFRVFKKVRDFNARDILDKIRCPMFIADPENEQFWPGQSQEVYDGLVSEKTILRFTQEEGDGWHCEPKARALYDQRMFDWLSTIINTQ